MDVHMLPMSIRTAHVTAEAGASMDMPILLLNEGPLWTLIDYFLHLWGERSLRWMERVTKSVALFIEYASCSIGELNPSEPHKFFQAFSRTLHTGTFVNGFDPKGLGWHARGNTQARQLIVNLNDYLQFLSEDRGDQAVHPRYTQSKFDRMMDEHAYQHKRSRAFLGHTWETHAPDKRQTALRARRTRSTLNSQPPAFPEDKFEQLLFKGFKTSRGFDYRNMLITLLLNKGGLRTSEPFHLYISDVAPDPRVEGSALVLVHHPEEGTVNLMTQGAGFDRRQKVFRTQYLLSQFDMWPRNRIRGKLHAGWKGGAAEKMYGSTFYRVYWFEPGAGRLFWHLWLKYLEQIADLARPHPFAFVNLHFNKGHPYTISQYIQAHDAAVERIGLTVSKWLGTTRHGHRHAYGQRLKNGGVDRKTIMTSMHHSALESQDVYTQPSSEEVRNALVIAAGNLAERSRRIIP